MKWTLVRRIAVLLSLSLVILGATTVAWQSNAQASSHREAPLISKDPSVDNTDVYAFVSPDAPNTITLISNWIPFEEPAGGPNFYHFDDNARYLIKVDKNGDGVEDVTFEWTFHTEIENPKTFLYNTGPITGLDNSNFNYRQYYDLAITTSAGRTVVGQHLLMPADNIGPRSTPNYANGAANLPNAVKTLTYNGNTLKEFSGQRADMFFVDVGSIFDLGGLRPFNAAHLIPLPQAAGVNSVAGFNIHTTSIQVPRELLARDCSMDPKDTKCVVGIWSTAERHATTVRTPGTETGTGAWVQVSRLGNPLVNEAVIDLARKDVFNAIPPTQDAAALDRVLDPELGRLIPVLYPGVKVPPAPRNDLVTVFLTGIPGLNQQTNSTKTPSEQLRLNVAIQPTAAVCKGNPMGVIAGDNAGYPNGRRIEDDVTDIALRAVAGGYPLTPAFDKAPNNQLGDGVNKPDQPCLPQFPYLGTPYQGYDHTHHTVGSTTTPPSAFAGPLFLGFGLTGLAGYGVSELLRRRKKKA